MSVSDLPSAARGASPWQSLTAVALALTVMSLAWALADGRIVDDAPNWLKPLKFSLSFTVLFATIALLEPRLSPAVQNGRIMRWTAFVMGLSFVAEMGWIIRQAAVGRASHFNNETPLEALMYGTVMAFGALALVICTALIGWAALRDTDARLGAATRWGVWLGFLLSCLLTILVAFTMSTIGRHVGVHPTGGATLPLFGWSGVTGDLRPAHFLSLHAMQALPLLGLWLDRPQGSGSVTTLQSAAVVYSGLTIALYVQALMGLPLIPMG